MRARRVRVKISFEVRSLLRKTIAGAIAAMCIASLSVAPAFAYGETIVNYHDLPRLVGSQNPTVRIAGNGQTLASEGADAIESQLGLLKKQIEQLEQAYAAAQLDPTQALTAVALATSVAQAKAQLSQLESQASSLRDTSVKTGLQANQAFTGSVSGAQQLYTGYFALAEQAKIAASKLEGLRRKIKVAEVKQSLNLLSKSELDGIQSQLGPAEDAVAQAESQMKSMLSQLKQLIGAHPDAPIALSGLPAFNPSDIALMNNGYDRMMVTSVSSAVRIKQEERNQAGSGLAATNAQIALDQARAKAQTDLDACYNTLQVDYQKYLTTKSQVELLQTTLENMRAKFDAGIVSRNSVLDLEEQLEQAQSGLRALEIGLFSKQQEYYGLLN